MQYQIKLWCNKCNREISQNENSYCMLCLYDKDEELHDQDHRINELEGKVVSLESKIRHLKNEVKNASRP